MNRLLKFCLTSWLKGRRLGHTLILELPWLDARLSAWRSRMNIAERGIAAGLMPNPIQLQGHWFYWRTEDFYILSRACAGIYEPEVHQAFVNLISPGMVICDVGAHIGWYTLLAAQRVGPTGHVYAFEAIPATAELLRRNIAINGYRNVTVVPMAVARTPGYMELQCDGESAGGSGMIPSSSKHEALRVACTSLDEYFAPADQAQVNFIKMDIEGAELLALGGMRKLVERADPKFKLIVELNPQKTPGEQLLKSLRSLGFSQLEVLERQRAMSVTEDVRELSETVNLLCAKEAVTQFASAEPLLASQSDR